MPVATIDPNETERFELQSAPADPNIPDDENGYIVVRPLPYGMKLTRQDRAVTMKMQMANPRNRGRGRNQREESTDAEIITSSEWSTAYDYANCIIDHNLTDRNGMKLDFSNPLSIKMLNPKIGSEIEDILNKVNGEDDEEFIKGFFTPDDSSSPDEEKTLQQDGGLTHVPN